MCFYKLPLGYYRARDERLDIQRGMNRKYPDRPCFGFQYGLDPVYDLSTHRHTIIAEMGYDFQSPTNLKRKQIRVKIKIMEPDSIRRTEIIQQILKILSKNTTLR